MAEPTKTIPPPAGPPDPARLDVDVAVMLGRGDWPNIVSEVLCREELLPVCSPRFLGGRAISHVRDLASLTLLHAVPRLSDWEQWLKAMGGDAGIDPYRGMRFDNSGMVYQAAVNALGVAMAQTAYIQEELEQGTLVVLFNAPLKTDRSYYVVYSPQKRADDKVIAFAGWLKREFERLKHLSDAPGAAAAHSSS